MKTFFAKLPAPALAATCVLLALSLPLRLHSDPWQAPPSTLVQLQAMKAKNQQLLEKQAATLQKLEDMELQAQQVKFLGKRS